jgi:uncharacterized membrane protein
MISAEPAEHYVSQSALSFHRRQAVRVWAVGTAIVLLWAAAIVVAPLAKSAGISWIADPLYGLYNLICHRIPERSFHVAGEQFGVCSRCFGVYFGLFAGFAVYPLWRKLEVTEPIARIWLFLSMIPIGIDWSLTIFGIWENTQASRFITGLILGVACATYLVPAAVEIVRNLTYRRRHRNASA